MSLDYEGLLFAVVKCDFNKSKRGKKSWMFFFLSHLTRTNKKSDPVVWVLANFGSHQESQKIKNMGQL